MRGFNGTGGRKNVIVVLPLSVLYCGRKAGCLVDIPDAEYDRLTIVDPHIKFEQTAPPNDDSTDLWHWMKFIKTDDEGM
ncbi:MAG: hypothetical protein FWG71_03820 [Synergistaceae bacterium]|nr:hypothetical protein [Synergistaceae bacterium]